MLYDRAPARALYTQLSVGSDAAWCADSGRLRSQFKALLLLQAQTVALGRWEAALPRRY